MLVCRRGTFAAGLFSDKRLSETILISSTKFRGPARVLTPGFDPVGVRLHTTPSVLDTPPLSRILFFFPNLY